MGNITFIPIKDVYVSEYYPDENFSSSIALFISRFEGAGDIYRSLIMFNLKTMANLIPPTSTIDLAELELTIFRNEVPAGGITVNVFGVIEGFEDNEVTWNNQPNASSTASGAINILPGVFGDITIDITELATGWYDNSFPNNGILIEGNETMDSLIAFRSTNYPDSRDWPKLKYEFSDGVINVFPTENVNVPANSTMTSSSIAFGPRNLISFLIENSGSTDLDVIIQVRNNTGTWVNSTESATSLNDGNTIELTTNAVAEEVRLLLTNNDPNNVAVVSISPATREA